MDVRIRRRPHDGESGSEEAGGPSLTLPSKADLRTVAFVPQTLRDHLGLSLPFQAARAPQRPHPVLVIPVVVEIPVGASVALPGRRTGRLASIRRPRNASDGRLRVPGDRRVGSSTSALSSDRSYGTTMVVAQWRARPDSHTGGDVPSLAHIRPSVRETDATRLCWVLYPELMRSMVRWLWPEHMAVLQGVPESARMLHSNASTKVAVRGHPFPGPAPALSRQALASLSKFRAFVQARTAASTATVPVTSRHPP